MSWQPPQYGVKGREQNWIHSLMSTHDCFCGCNDPITHLIKVTTKDPGYFNFNKQTALKLLQCPSTTTTEETTGDKDGDHKQDGEEDILDDVDLQKLFDEDGPFDESDTG